MPFARPAAGVAAAAVFGWLATIAFQAGIKDSRVFQGIFDVRAMLEPGAKQATQERLAEMHDEVSRDVDVLGGNATAHELLGLIDIRRGGEVDYGREATVHLKKSLELRPTSPYTWSALAAADYRLGDTSSEFRSALRHAMETGPNEPEVDVRVTDLGLAVWDELDPKTRSEVENAVAVGMHHEPARVLQVAERRGRLGTACRHAVASSRQSDSKWLQLCQSMEATP